MEKLEKFSPNIGAKLNESSDVNPIAGDKFMVMLYTKYDSTGGWISDDAQWITEYDWSMESSDWDFDDLLYSSHRAATDTAVDCLKTINNVINERDDHSFTPKAVVTRVSMVGGIIT